MQNPIIHPFEPIFSASSRILLLGTLPSPASRANGFYYAHPRNRFWKVLADVFGEPLPANNEERRSLILRRNLALWDVAASCTIDGASDASIRNVRANDISRLVTLAPIKRIGCTGKRAAELYRKLAEPQTGIPAAVLPSTSPANCALSYEALFAAYRDFLTGSGPLQ